MSIPVIDFHDFFPALADETKAEIDALCSYRNVLPDTHLIRNGAYFTELYQIQSGYVKYSTVDHAGREAVLLYMAQGDWIGLSEVFSGLPAYWNVVAHTPVRLRVISQRDFESMVKKHSTLALELLKLFAHRFSIHRLVGPGHHTLSLKERLIKMLYVLSLSYGKGAPDTDPVVMSLSQEELSKVVGSSRQKLNPALQELAREGLLEVKFGGVTLGSRAGLVERYGYLLNAIS